MIVKYFFILLCFLFSTFISSQSEESIIKLQDSIKDNIYSNPTKAIYFLHKYLKLNEKSNSIDNIILANSALAAAHEVKNQIDSTLYYHYKNLSIVQKPLDLINTKHSIARVLESSGKYKQALRLYYQILELAKKNNFEEKLSTVKISIQSLKNKIGESKDAISLLREDYENKLINDDSNLRFTRKRLIEAYIKDEAYNEALNLINIGGHEAKISEDCEFVYYMNILKSKIEIILNQLDAAKISSNQALLCAKQIDNQGFVNKVKFRESEIAFLKRSYQSAIKTLKTIESSFVESSPIERVKYYKLIADTYKALDSTELFAAYYSKYIKEKDQLSDTKVATLETFYNLNLNEQMSEIKDVLDAEKLEKEKFKQTKVYWTILSVLLIVSILIIVIFFKRKSNENEKRFNALMEKINVYEARKNQEKLSPKTELSKAESLITKTTQTNENIVEEVSESNENSNKNQAQSKEQFNIDDKKIEEILVKLQKLEDKQFFLRQDCTLHTMAKKLKTNTSYLSRIINTHLNKSFSTYINELRINYVILELKNNKRLRSYSIKGIAQEVGYKNADAFSRYFRSATGISPSLYIKKIDSIKSA